MILSESGSIFWDHVLLRPAPVDGVEPYREHQDGANDNALEGRVDPEQNHARLERLHEHGAEHRSGNGADAARQRRSADDSGRDHQQFGERAF